VPKKVALFVDVESLHQHLRTAHNRSLDPALVLAAAKARGEVVSSAALADWAELPPELKEAFAALGVPTVQLDRAARSRDVGGRRRDITRDLVDLEVLARVIEVLFPAAGGPEVDIFVIGTTDDAAVRAVQLTRERFQKEVVVLGAEGGVSDALRAAASACELLPMPPVEPRDLEGLAQLVPLLEDLERRKRYLNFKYIRETVVRRLERVERSFDAAERLLSDAIGCGILLKQKIEDKYNPGQLFTAYGLNRAHEMFQQYGSGEPAPLHEDGGPAPTPTGAEGPGAAQDDAPAAPAQARPSLSASRPRPEPRREPARPRPDTRVPVARQDDGDDDDRELGPPSTGGDRGHGGQQQRRGRRRRGRGAGAQGNGGPPEPQPSQLHAGGGQRGRGGRGHAGQDRLGAKYEAPSRFLYDEVERPVVPDDDIDEEKILRARGDA
jgi:hypothetical protein